MTQDRILFPDAMPHLVGDIRTTHTLRATREKGVWSGDNGVEAVYCPGGGEGHDGSMMHLKIALAPLNDPRGWFLKWDVDKERWAVGASPSEVKTVFLIRDIPGGKTLEIRDAEKAG